MENDVVVVDDTQNRWTCRKYFKFYKSSLSRAILMAHGIYSIIQINSFVHLEHWLLAVPLALIPVEGFVTWKKLAGKEFKWFCPNVFLYLSCVIPVVCFLELDISDTINKKSRHFSLRNTTSEQIETELSRLTSVTRIQEQIILLVLIFNRWIMPRQQISSEQKSALLMSYMGVAADILELFDAFNNPVYSSEKKITLILLAIWSLSMIQFCFVLTAVRDTPHSSRLVNVLFQTETWAIGLNIVVQELPFLIIRLYLQIVYKIVDNGALFFVIKNGIVTLLSLFHIYALCGSIPRTSSSTEIDKDIPLTAIEAGKNEMNPSDDLS